MADPVRGGPPAPDAPTDKLLDTIHSELALGFDFLKLDVGAMETEALAEHVAKRVRALFAAGTTEGGGSESEVSRLGSPADRHPLAAGTPQPTPEMLRALAGGEPVTTVLTYTTASPPLPCDTSADECDCCGRPQSAHTGVERFCPFIATFRARAVVPPPPDTAAAPTDGDLVRAYADARQEARDVEGRRRRVRGDFDELPHWVGHAEGLRAVWLRAPAPATDDAPTEAEAVERDAELLWRFWMREHRGDDLILWSEVAVKDEWRRVTRELRARLASPRATAPAPQQEVNDGL